MVAARECLERAGLLDDYYGTSRGNRSSRSSIQGQDVLLEIDWRHARPIRRALPECRSIFVLPPSGRGMEQRLRNRATDSDEVIARRLRDSIADLSHWSKSSTTS